MEKRKRPRQHGMSGPGASWSRQKKAKSGPALPRTLMQELGLQKPVEKSKAKKKPSDQQKHSQTSLKPRAKQLGDPSVQAGQEAIQEELRLQAALAKKLKLKQGSKLSGPDDGLDDLLKGLEDLNGTIPTGKVPELLQSDDEADLLDDDEGEEEDLNLGNDSDEDDSEEDEDVLLGDDSGSGEDSLLSAEHQGRDSQGETSDEDEEDDDEQAIDMQLDDEEYDSDEEAVDMQLQGDTEAKPKYVPPAARKLEGKAAVTRQAPPTEAKKVSQEERAAIQRKVRSLLNRVAVANLPRVASQLAEVFDSAPKSLVASCVTESIMQAVQEGPRAADQFAAVSSCLVVMTSVLVNMQQLLANVVLALAQALQKARSSEDSIAASNIVTIFCFLHACDGIDHKLLYSLLGALKAGFSDQDVRLMLLVLQTVGQQIRTSEPGSFKTFIERLETKMSALAGEEKLSQRSRLMLELIVEMRHSKKIKEKNGAGSLESNLNADVLQQLRSCNVERVALHNLTWKQLTTGEHKGTWWLPRDAQRHTVAEGGTGRGSAGATEADAVMQLAVKQRMNTDSRRAIFCILMSAEDYMEAFERLLRLPLKGTADRDIAHVLLHCCLQEQQWNPYYALVSKQLMLAAKTYKVSMQFAIQDRLRHAHDLNARQAANLAEFLAYLLAHKALSLVVFKVLQLQQPTSRTTLFCRICLQRLIQIPKSTDDLKRIFGSLRQPKVRGEIRGIIRHVVRPWAAGLPDGMEKDGLLARMKVVDNALKAPAIEAGLGNDGTRLLAENSSDDDDGGDGVE